MKTTEFKYCLSSSFAYWRQEIWANAHKTCESL